MGCDGGTIPTRGEVVKQKKKAETVDRDILIYARWLYCALSSEELTQPIVACELGRLFNKEALITFLLDRDRYAEHGIAVAGHIRSLRDVVTLNLTPNEEGNGATRVESADAYTDRQAARYVCPVSGLEMNGRYRFCYLRSCGCVLSEKALREIPATSCHRCGKGFGEDDVIVLNGDEEAIVRNRAKMEARRLQAKAAKKEKGAAKEASRKELSESGKRKASNEDIANPSKKLATETKDMTTGFIERRAVPVPVGGAKGKQ